LAARRLRGRSRHAPKDTTWPPIPSIVEDHLNGNFSGLRPAPSQLSLLPSDMTGFGAGDSRGHGGFLYSLGFHLLLGRVYDNKDVQERIVRRSKLRPASIGLPKNGDDGRVGEARRITFAVINVTENVRGDLSAHVITVFELNRQKIARAIECDGHDAESVGIIDTIDVVRRDHSLYLTVAKDISSPQARTKKRAISHPQMRSTINSTNPIPTSSTASATESYSSQCR
jgi:hypothetical protein